METRNASEKRVLTYGTFDLLHIGHVNLLKRARALGGHLTVGLSTDDFNRLKGKIAIYPFEHRRSILESIRYVDSIILESSWDQKREDIAEHDIDIVVMGDDWEGKFDHLKEWCEVVYLPRTPGISSTAIRLSLLSMDLDLMKQRRADG